MRLVEEIAEGDEFFLDGTEHRPDFAGAFLDGEGAESHLEAVEDRGDGGRSRDDDFVFALQRIRESRATEYFGIQALYREEEDAEIGGIRWIEVFVANVFRFGFDAVLECLAQFVDEHRIILLFGIDETLEIFERKFRIDREPDMFDFLVFRGDLDGEFDAISRIFLRRDILLVLLCGHHLIEEIAELYFAPGTACLHILQNLLQIPYPGREGLHFAESFVHEVESFTYEFERFAEPFLEGGMEFLIHGLAHFFQFLTAVFLNIAEAFIYGLSHFFHLDIICLREFVEPLKE